MSSTDKIIDESRLKELYKEKIRKYLPQEWGDYKVDDFVDALFMGLLYNHNSEYGRVIYRIRKKWFFKWQTVYDNGKPIGEKYYPNPAIIRVDKKQTEQKSN